MQNSKRRLAHSRIGNQYRNPILLTRDWQGALENGGCFSASALARRVGLSRARVSQVLKLLTLAPEAQKILADCTEEEKAKIAGENAARVYHLD